MRYEGFIDRFKSKITIDECIVSGEAKELLTAAKAEIQNLRSNIRKAKESTVQVRKDMNAMKRQIYMHEQTEKLPEILKKKARNLCEGASSMYKIDEIIREVKSGK